MPGTLQPLDGKFAIVDANGNPTEYFTRWAQQKQIDIGDSITLADLQAYLTAHKLIAGTGIQLTPDGDINDGVTIHADAQAILDEITATRGAILYRGLLGWAALLPDTLGKVLSTNGAGADPSWITPTGGGGGGTETLIQEVVTSASQPSVSFAAIAATYRDLRIMVRGRGTAAATNVNVQFQFNGDTAANYEWSLMKFLNTTSQSGGTTGVTQIAADVLPAASASALAPGSVETIIPDYRGTTFHKSTSSRSVAQTGATGATMSEAVGYGRWKSAAAINAVKVFLSSGNFVDGSVVSLYGRM